jgi:hypothetical protein
MDRLRLVTFTKGGRPTVRLDLNDGTIYAMVRDSLKFDGGERQQQWVDSTQRYEGSRLTAESQKNAQLSTEWYISGGGVADTALQRMEALMVELESLEEDRYIEWRPEGATRSTYFPIRGPSAWEFLYRWIEFQATKTLHLKAGWSIAPLAEGDRMYVLDDFAVDSIADYTWNSTTGVTVSGGTLHFGTAGSARTAVLTSRSDKYSDAQVTQKILVGATATTWSWSVLLKSNAAGTNALYASINQAGTLAVGKIVGGTPTNLATAAATAPSAATNYWLRLRTEGSALWAEWFTSAPTLTSTPATTAGPFNLTGGDIAAFGAGVQGYAGFTLNPFDVNYTLDDFTVEPFVYTSTSPSIISASPTKIPGSAPAKADVTVAQSGLATPFGLVAWTETPVSPLADSTIPFGVFDVETWTLSTLASTADGGAHNGLVARTITSGAGSGSVTQAFSPEKLSPDDFSRNEVDLEIWGRVQVNASVITPVAIASAFPTGGLAPTRYTQEWGSLGRTIALPSSGATVYRLTRLGTITLPVDVNNPVSWNLRVALTWGAGSGGVYGLDYVILVPVKSRACSPTSKANDATYPDFIGTTAAVFKTINSDLTTRIAVPGSASATDTSVAGSLIYPSPGLVSWVVKLSDYVPDDPTFASTGESTASTTNKVQINVIPRYWLPRGT